MTDDYSLRLAQALANASGPGVPWYGGENMLQGVGKQLANALMAPGNAYQSTPENPVTTEQMVKPAADLAMMTTLGAGAMPAETNAANMGIRAYHGSPYDFDKFDLAKIGTGEGAQAYGHGLYFAENPQTAQTYRNLYANRSIDVPISDAKVPDWVAANLRAIQEGQPSKYTTDGLIQEFNNRIAEKQKIVDAKEGQYWNDESHIPGLKEIVRGIENFKAGAKVPPPGRMYEVNINAEPQQFLDWDKPLSQQPQGIQNIASEHFNPGMSISPQDWTTRYINSPETGADVYQSLRKAKLPSGNQYIAQASEATKALQEAGIPGIKYLDQGSRNFSALKVEPHEFLNGQTGFKVNGPRGDQFFDTRGEAQSFIDSLNKGQTSNYVVFNPDIVDILKKWSIAGAAPGAALAQALNRQQDNQ